MLYELGVTKLHNYWENLENYVHYKVATFIFWKLYGIICLFWKLQALDVIKLGNYLEKLVNKMYSWAKSFQYTSQIRYTDLIFSELT